jgi:hypothetical protein
MNGVFKRPTGRVDHIGANHKTCRGPLKKTSWRHKREVEDDGAVRTVPGRGKKLPALLLYAQRSELYQKTLKLSADRQFNFQA